MATLLILSLVLALVVALTVLYNNYVFHNLFFQGLSSENVESVSVYNYNGKGMTQLSPQETAETVALLRKIRFREEPYKNFGLMGDKGDDFHIKLKNGIEFDLNLSGGDPGVYIIGENAYSIGYRDDPNTAEAFENLWELEALYDSYALKYSP